MTAETALPDQLVDVKVSINYGRTLGRWMGWIIAAVIGGLLAKFGERYETYMQRTGRLVPRVRAGAVSGT